ncbi:hypothetical protein FVEN_g2706 [Fusarium venenatum]|uniref:Ricin B lectin domain-containing protein n=1 Tax=Fusarium venenatum TaxID=56646 RepID=A0A2L2SXN0_9HYPO|nr:uncharacterized protein FVRRES_06074 [Fusarium venenatum]KAG8359655.1 hypothetical protein FVEN_g2706 [Fusarium venenatum]CEI61638.1 unnamed protein product [Fusarium venenatum]
MVHHRKQKTPMCQPQRSVSLPPICEVEKVMFECTQPTQHPAITRITTPLPFSNNISKNLAWAAAFIDRAGHLTKDYELLEKRLHAAIDTIGNDAIEMTLLRQQLRDQSRRVQSLELKVSGQANEQQELEQRLANTRDLAAKTESDLTSKLRNTERALQQSKAAEGRLKNKLDKTLLEEHERWEREAKHDRADHASLDAAYDALEKSQQDKTALQSELDNKIQELAATKHELNVAQEAMSTCKANCEEKSSQIETLTQQLATANRTNTELSASIDSTAAQLTSKNQEIADLTESLNQANNQLATANQTIAHQASTIATLEASLAGVQDERDQKLKLLEDLQESTQATQKALQDKIDELSAHDLDDHQRLEAATEAKRLSDESIKDLQAKVDAANAHDADVQARLQAEEEAKRAAEAELERVKLQLEEANKPKLPNTVTLSNPIPIVGSLGGATNDFDDIFYPIVSSFPVTIYGHSSTSIFVSINGLLSLDTGDRTYTHQPLPFRNGGLPAHTLPPFWCDLFIYKDTPQGIYYEIVGQAPSRSLCVEWYVSRYGDKDQYYHFLVLLEEARPNIVTYKYFEALDKGAKCTIGAQGPDSAQQWSYNETKALPGVQVVIDTGSGSVTESTFTITN